MSRTYTTPEAVLTATGHRVSYWGFDIVYNEDGTIDTSASGATVRAERLDSNGNIIGAPIVEKIAWAAIPAAARTDARAWHARMIQLANTNQPAGTDTDILAA